MIDNHGDEVLCQMCNSKNVVPVLMEGHATSEFAYAITRRKDGTVVDPPFLGTIQAVHCETCEHDFALLDSPKSPEPFPNCRGVELLILTGERNE